MTGARFRLFVRELTPPVLWRALKRAKKALRGQLEPAAAAPPVETPGPPEWEYVPEGWRRGTKGWDADGVVAAYREKWPSYVEALREPNPLGVYHEVVAGTGIEAHDR